MIEITQVNIEGDSDKYQLSFASYNSLTNKTTEFDETWEGNCLIEENTRGSEFVISRIKIP